ncbi:MAG TPA: YqgQ family protein [Bacilli bacterium]|nr:YqgQ family protein [Bacilli bacterium]
MDYELHSKIMRIRNLLKGYNILVYTGNQLDDLTLMEMELDDLHEEKYMETAEYLEMKMQLRTAVRQLEAASS